MHTFLLQKPRKSSATSSNVIAEWVQTMYYMVAHWPMDYNKSDNAQVVPSRAKRHHFHQRRMALDIQRLASHAQIERLHGRQRPKKMTHRILHISHEIRHQHCSLRHSASMTACSSYPGTKTPLLSWMLLWSYHRECYQRMEISMRTPICFETGLQKHQTIGGSKSLTSFAKTYTHCSSIKAKNGRRMAKGLVNQPS